MSAALCVARCLAEQSKRVRDVQEARNLVISFPALSDLLPFDEETKSLDGLEDLNIIDVTALMLQEVVKFPLS